MPHFPSSLLGAVQTYHESGLTVGVLVIDEINAGQPGGLNDVYAQNVRRDQIRALNFTSRLNCPTWLIELNPPLVLPNPHPTPVQLRAILPPGYETIQKAGFSAFHNTPLNAQLTHAGVRMVLLMGRQTNHCVRMTALGGPAGSHGHGHVEQGAVGAGYTVLSSPRLLHHGAPTWADHQDVEMYANL